MKKREATTIAVHGARDEPGSRAITDESSQLTADLCDLNLVARKKGDPTRAAGGGPGKNRRAPRRSSEPESVCRSADWIKTPWIIHRRDRTQGPTTGSLPACLRCASSARLPSKRHEAMVKANLHTVFLMIIFWIKKEACKLYPRDKTKIIIRKKRKSGGTNDKSI